MAHYLLLVQANPDDTQTGLRALEQAEQLVAQGEQVSQVFFYGQGVLYANCFLSFPSGLPNLQATWQQLSRRYNIPLVVCATVASQYGLEALEPPTGNLAEDFHAGGLTEFMSTLANCDTLLQFPAPTYPAEQTKTSQQVTFLFTQLPLHASARHGLDMLLMAESLEQDAIAIFTGEGVWQLVCPTIGADPLKKMDMLPDIFDFEGFYTTAYDLEQAGLSLAQLRVPVTLLTAERIDDLVNRHSKHVLRF
ncbi:MAG TPA: DsrE family protein [Aliidiomarina sp.]|nr:DsrE family protein [Aliidiomarina sp.]